MVDNAKHKDSQDKRGFSKGKSEAPRKKVSQPKDTSKTREAKASRAEKGKR